MPTVCQTYAFGPFTLALIGTNLVQYVSVICVLQVGSFRTHLLLKTRNTTKLFQTIKESKEEKVV